MCLIFSFLPYIKNANRNSLVTYSSYCLIQNRCLNIIICVTREEMTFYCRYIHMLFYTPSLYWKKNTQSTSKLEHTCHWQFYPFSKNFSNFFMVCFLDSKLVSFKRKIVIKSKRKPFGSKSFIIIVWQRKHTHLLPFQPFPNTKSVT